MPAQFTPLGGAKAIGTAFTEKPVTAWAGLALFIARGTDRPRRAAQGGAPVRRDLAERDPPHQVLLAFCAGVLAGTRRFAQLALLRVHESVRQLFGLRRSPSTATFTLFFRRFTAPSVTTTSEPLLRWCVARLPVWPSGYTLDLDSSIFALVDVQGWTFRPSVRKTLPDSTPPVRKLCTQEGINAGSRCRGIHPMPHVVGLGGHDQNRPALSPPAHAHGLLVCGVSLRAAPTPSGSCEARAPAAAPAGHLPRVCASRRTSPPRTRLEFTEI